MISAEDSQKIVKFGTVMKMFQTFADLIQEEKIVNDQGLVYSVTRGRYTNSSIVKWLDAHADGLVYGVQIPKYSHSTTTQATKTDANADLVLEPSSPTVAGRNDYEGKKLFWCVRVNGGVDADGMPYVTAIEGQDDRFDCESADTWALTPVYYVKRTETDEYRWNQFSDTQLEGFEPCYGAFTLDGAARPYILRACYLDSEGNCSSRSGGRTNRVFLTDPSTGSTANASLDLMLRVVNAREDGITLFSHGDFAYIIEFMQLMFGVKAPKSIAAGDRCSPGIVKIVRGNVGKSFFISSDHADLFKVGRYASAVGPWDQEVLGARRIIDVETVDGVTQVHVDVEEDFDTRWSNASASIVPARSGSCDEVLGTFGSFDLDLFSEGEAPFRFQNIECMNGMGSAFYDLGHFGGGEIRVLREPGGLYSNDAWHLICEASRSSYVADLECVDGVLVKTAENATSGTGYMARWDFTALSDVLVACPYHADEDGLGSIRGADWNPGLRASAIGLSSWPDAQA